LTFHETLELHRVVYSSSLLLSSLELSDTQSLCALNTSPPRNRCTFRGTWLSDMYSKMSPRRLSAASFAPRTCQRALHENQAQRAVHQNHLPESGPPEPGLVALGACRPRPSPPAPAPGQRSGERSTRITSRGERSTRIRHLPESGPPESDQALVARVLRPPHLLYVSGFLMSEVPLYAIPHLIRDSVRAHYNNASGCDCVKSLRL